eukprot:Hpha_TRINITY_DN15005_c0_g1::TRINITY_DN15005_c0_g1_i2::g.126037::m.126037
MAEEPLTHTPMPLAYAGACYPKRQDAEGLRSVSHARGELLGLLRDTQGVEVQKDEVPLPKGVDGLAFTVGGALSKAECEALMGYSEAVGFEEAKVNIDFEGHDIKERRNNWRTMIDDAEVAEILFERVKAFVPPMEGMVPCGSNSKFRVLRYDAGQQFTDHKDGKYEDPETKNVSLLTFQIYLNDGFEKGYTTLVGDDGEASEVHPVAGKALLFSHDIVHRGVPPVGGRKYALRSEIMFKNAARAP